MRDDSIRNELRCFCSRQPLLATFGLDSDGRLFIHIKVYKQGRIYGEVKIRGNADTEIHCRECLRWQRIVIRQPNKPVLELIEESSTVAT